VVVVMMMMMIRMIIIVIIYQFFSVNTGCRFSVAFRHSCRFIASSDDKFLCFITLSTSAFHYALGCPRPPGDHVIIRLGHLLSSVGTTCP